MEFNEELLTDEGYRRLNALQQYELIAEHCRDIEERIRTAPSHLEARRIADAACARMKEACRSTLVKTALEANVENLIARYWDAQMRE